MIKNIVFDFGGVIADFDYRQALAAFARIGLQHPEEYLDSFHQRGFFWELESGQISADEFVQQLSRCAQRELDYDTVRTAWLGFFPTPVLRERLVALEQLRRRYKLYILSNTNPFIMSWARSDEFSSEHRPLDDYFDGLYLSYEMHCMKPAREIFDRMAQQARLTPDETLYIDDSAANIAAGAALGYRTYCPKSNADWREPLGRILETR